MVGRMSVGDYLGAAAVLLGTTFFVAVLVGGVLQWALGLSDRVGYAIAVAAGIATFAYFLKGVIEAAEQRGRDEERFRT